MISGNLDRELLLTLNSLLGKNELYFLLFSFLDLPLIRGFPIFFTLIALWFSDDCRKHRSRMIAGLLATCLATVISVWSQHNIPTHIRPLLDPELHLQIADPQWTSHWDRKGSFPSDTATLYFSFAMVILLENRLAGYLCFLWVFAVICGTRVIFGFHYPSDIIGSLILGPGCVYLLNKIPYFGMLFERVLKSLESRIYIVHALLFVFLADAYILFRSLEQLSKGLVRLVR
jgi:membrane-associated phospholipid phosphatase